MHKISILLPNLRFGGAEKLHINLAEDWIKKGYKVEFVLMQKSGEYLSMIPNGVSIFNLNVSHFRNVIFPLASYLRKYRPDIILAAMWPLTSYAIISWFISKKIGKLYVSEHAELSFSEVYSKAGLRFLLRKFIQFSYPFSNGIIAVSEAVKSDLVKIGRLNEEKIKVIYNPVAKGGVCIEESIDSRNELWGEGWKYNILTVGELKKVKDHENLITAFSLLPEELNAKLIILGDGNLKESLIQLVNRLNLTGKVEFTGFVRDPYPWYLTADLFVLSSISEGFGNVIVEALECGVPVVSTNSGGAL